jgi:hypothetical protein
MRTNPILAGTLFTLVAAGGCSDSPAEPAPTEFDVMRQATTPYQDIQSALAEGFIQLSPCVASPAGGMGVHIGHPDRIADAVIDPALPEILLYEPTHNGGMRLVGVEFMVHRDAWYGAGNGAPPAVAGQSFDAPNPNHPDEHLRDFYMLHVWVWQDNPAGIFAPFNPTVSCPAGPASHGGH